MEISITAKKDHLILLMKKELKTMNLLSTTMLKRKKGRVNKNVRLDIVAPILHH